MTADRVDELLNLHVESKQKVLELFGVDPSWQGFHLSDDRGRWWCIVHDEILSQYQEHGFDEETLRHGWYRVQMIVRPQERSLYELEHHVLVFVESDFGKAFCVFDVAKRLTDEQTQLVRKNM